jgi:hypothetical protein
MLRDALVYLRRYTARPAFRGWDPEAESTVSWLLFIQACFKASRDRDCLNPPTLCVGRLDHDRRLDTFNELRFYVDSAKTIVFSIVSFGLTLEPKQEYIKYSGSFKTCLWFQPVRLA